MKYLLEAVTNTDTHTQEKYRHTKAHFSSAVASRTQFPVGPLTATAVAHSQDRDVSNSDDDADVSADDVSAAEKNKKKTNKNARLQLWERGRREHCLTGAFPRVPLLPPSGLLHGLADMLLAAGMPFAAKHAYDLSSAGSSAHTCRSTTPTTTEDEGSKDAYSTSQTPGTPGKKCFWCCSVGRPQGGDSGTPDPGRQRLTSDNR